MNQYTPPTIKTLQLFLLLLLLTACSTPNNDPPAAADQVPFSITLTSSAFDDGRPIPAIYTCDGDDLSPPLQWNNLPQNTAALVLIMDDPDAPGGTWVHWLLYNLPPITSKLPENAAFSDPSPGGSTQGSNSWDRSDYGGPCPPRGSSHHYYFKLYALDSQLSLDPGLTKEQLLQATQGHILAQGQLIGTYKRD